MCRKSCLNIHTENKQKQVEKKKLKKPIEINVKLKIKLIGLWMWCDNWTLDKYYIIIVMCNKCHILNTYILVYWSKVIDNDHTLHSKPLTTNANSWIGNYFDKPQNSHTQLFLVDKYKNISFRYNKRRNKKLKIIIISKLIYICSLLVSSK